MKYFHVLPGRIGRLDKKKNPYRLQGLCADYLCSAPVITGVSKDKNRMVIMHADHNMRIEDVANQLAWLGDQPVMTYFILGDAKDDRVTCQRQFVLSLLPSTQHCAAVVMPIVSSLKGIVLRADKVTFSLTNELPEEIFCHPQSRDLVALHVLDVSYTSLLATMRNLQKFSFPPLIFDGERCIPLLTNWLWNSLNESFSQDSALDVTSGFIDLHKRLQLDLFSTLTAQGLKSRNDMTYEQLSLVMNEAISIFYLYFLSRSSQPLNFQDFLEKVVHYCLVKDCGYVHQKDGTYSRLVGEEFMAEFVAEEDSALCSAIMLQLKQVKSLFDLEALSIFIEEFNAKEHSKTYLQFMVRVISWAGEMLYFKYDQKKYMPDISPYTLESSSFYQPEFSAQQQAEIIGKLENVTSIRQGWSFRKSEGVFCFLSKSEKDREFVLNFLNQSKLASTELVCGEHKNFQWVKVSKPNVEKLDAALADPNLPKFLSTCRLIQG